MKQPDQEPAVEQRRTVETIVLPVVQEEVLLEKRVVDTGGVRVRKAVREYEEVIDTPLEYEEVEVRNVPVNRFVDGAVEVRIEGETTIIPVLEEVLVIEKRLLLKEELHVTRKRRESREQQRVLLRQEEPVIERLEPPARNGADGRIRARRHG